MTADRGFRSARMSWTIWRDTPSAFAAAVMDSPTSGRISSRRISPGCTGGNPFLRSSVFSLMVVFKVDILRVFARPRERDAVVAGDAHRPSLRGAVQAVEPVPCQIHLFRLSCYFQRLKNTHALPEKRGADSTCLAGEVDLFQPFMSKAAHHPS